MITLNTPFILALTLIVFFAAVRWLEWYLNEEKPSKKAGNAVLEANQKSQLAPIKRSLKKFFLNDTELKRPWYINLLIALIFPVQFLIVDPEKWSIWQIEVFYAVILILITCLDMLFVMRANREIFSEKKKKSHYIKTQIMQGMAMLMLLVIAIGIIQVHLDRAYADPPDLADRVDWIIEPTFEADWPRFSEGLAPVGKSGNQGFIDMEGHIVIPLIYDDADPFSEGLAAVEEDGKWGYIDRQGNQVIPCQYDEAFAFGDGLAPVQTGDEWMVIDRQGAIAFRTDYKSIMPYHEGVATVEVRDSEYHSATHDNLIDKSGKLLFKGQYDLWNDFNEGCIPVRNLETNMSYYLDKNEQTVIPFNYNEARKFLGGYAPVWFKDGGFALIDHFGNVVININEDEFYDFSSFSEGLVTFHRGEWNGKGENLYRSGFKDIYGNVLIPADFQRTGTPGEGLIALRVNGLWGFIKNPLPEAARVSDPALWQADRTEIATVEGFPVYAGELEKQVYDLRVEGGESLGAAAYKKAFRQLMADKALAKFNKQMEPDRIRYQIGNEYYKLLLLGK